MSVIYVFAIAVVVGAALCGFALYVEHSWRVYRLMREWERRPVDVRSIVYPDDTRAFGALEAEVRREFLP